MVTLCIGVALRSSGRTLAAAFVRKALPFRTGAFAAIAAVVFNVVVLPTTASLPPPVVISAGSPEIFVDGDCNDPAIWVDGELRLYGSPYPQNGSMGGVANYRHGPSLAQLTQTATVTPDRSGLGSYTPPAFGPWFESILVDDAGVLWAYYHAEFPDAQHDNKVHPRIGAQVSRDKGETWQDLGILIDTPAGTDEYHSWLGGNFSGGNGDFSVILDPEKNYVYFFYSQYGYTDDAQGLAVARMRWCDRATPVGQVKKWYQGAWQGAGLGGPATPFLRNAGDVHGIRSPFDFWWGPSIHWNTYLQRYVILLSRSNVGDFAYRGGIDNWYMTSATLDDPTHWDDPSALPFPEGYQGSWYPEVVGSDAGETDKLAGRDARLFVQGYSRWQIRFLRPGEDDSTVKTNIRPVVSTLIPDQSATAGSPFIFTPGSDTFTDSEGETLTWSVTGLPSAFAFDSTTHAISGTPAADTIGQSWRICVTVTDPQGLSVTTGFNLEVLAPPVPGPVVVTPPRSTLQITVGDGASDQAVALGTTLDITGRATDLDGGLVGHWLEIRNPSGVWSWDGWLATEAWGGALGGSAFASVKTNPFTFDEPGIYLVRTTVVDKDGNWKISAEVHLYVGPSSLPLAQIELAGKANNLEVKRGAIVAVTGRATDLAGDIKEHWLEIRNPAGAWSWEGWLTAEPWGGALGGDAFSSVKSTFYTFDQAGDYLVRSTVLNSKDEWIVSTQLAIHVVDTDAH